MALASTDTDFRKAQSMYLAILLTTWRRSSRVIIQFQETRIEVLGNFDECDLNKAYKSRKYFIYPSLLDVHNLLKA